MTCDEERLSMAIAKGVALGLYTLMYIIAKGDEAKEDILAELAKVVDEAIREILSAPD